MTTYAYQNDHLFWNEKINKKFRVRKKRSTNRLKRYCSTIDNRLWSSNRDERRQAILQLIDFIDIGILSRCFCPASGGDLSGGPSRSNGERITNEGNACKEKVKELENEIGELNEIIKLLEEACGKGEGIGPPVPSPPESLLRSIDTGGGSSETGGRGGSETGGGGIEAGGGGSETGGGGSSIISPGGSKGAGTDPGASSSPKPNIDHPEVIDPVKIPPKEESESKNASGKGEDIGPPVPSPTKSLPLAKLFNAIETGGGGSETGGGGSETGGRGGSETGGGGTEAGGGGSETGGGGSSIISPGGSKGAGTDPGGSSSPKPNIDHPEVIDPVKIPLKEEFESKQPEIIFDLKKDPCENIRSLIECSEFYQQSTPSQKSGQSYQSSKEDVHFSEEKRIALYHLRDEVERMNFLLRKEITSNNGSKIGNEAMLILKAAVDILEENWLNEEMQTAKLYELSEKCKAQCYCILSLKSQLKEANEEIDTLKEKFGQLPANNLESNIYSIKEKQSYMLNEIKKLELMELHLTGVQRERDKLFCKLQEIECIAQNKECQLVKYKAEIEKQQEFINSLLHKLNACEVNESRLEKKSAAPMHKPSCLINTPSAIHSSSETHVKRLDSSRDEIKMLQEKSNQQERIIETQKRCLFEQKKFICEQEETKSTLTRKVEEIMKQQIQLLHERNELCKEINNLKSQNMQTEEC